MQTINTKFLPSTNTLGARIVVTTSSSCCIKITSPWDYSLSTDQNHITAAKKLAGLLKWQYNFIGGHTPTGMVFVIDSNLSSRFKV